MYLPYRSLVYTTVFLLTFLKISLAKKYINKCPIGFNLAYPKYKDDDDPICYRRKGPELFQDKFKNCAGNMFTSKLYHKYNLTEINLVLWTDYKNAYPGGPFIDWSYTKDIGTELKINDRDKIEYNPLEELCVVIDPVNNFTATKCDDMHYRYCFVKPYVEDKDMSNDGCDDLDGYLRFWSPKPTCLTTIMGARGTGVRANWRLAKEMCVKRGGSLLSKGWRYANYPWFSNSPANPTFPLGIVLSSDNISIRFDTTSDEGVIPSSEWHFENRSVSTNMSFGALREDFWYLVNGTYIFYNVICERSLQLPEINMNVSVDLEGKIILKTDQELEERTVYCFTDSSIYYSIKVGVRKKDDYTFIVQPIEDGYYWCTHIDTFNYPTTISNKVLFIREKQSLINFYAIKLKVDTYTNNTLGLHKYWKQKLEEYIFYRTKYEEVFGEIQNDPITSEAVLKEFKMSHKELKLKENKLIYNMKLKMYVPGKYALLHVQLSPDMSPVNPGTWDDLEVEYMKPVYYCKGLDSVPMLPLGSSTSQNCRNYSCVGDFNEGVQWVTTAAEGCTTTVALTTAIETKDINLTMPTVVPSTSQQVIRDDDSDSDEANDRPSTKYTTSPPPPPTTTTELPPTTVTEVVTTVTTVTTEEVVTVTTSQPPTTVPSLPPDQQLQQVMNDLESLVHNDTAVFTVDDITDTFDQVDTLLDIEESIEFPSNFLHLLDQLGEKIDLNGSASATAVRSNIAMLLADAEPSAPVRGLRIASRDSDMFTADAFEIISEEVNSTHLTANTTEAVVHLPDSIASSTRRISFVVFRNDRAFQSMEHGARVNSRVLSINVENLTSFDTGEYVDIHISPETVSASRNESRVCAYWHFFENGSAGWSTDGCVLIESSEEGVLDTCRCDHLTHFAEILLPKAVFSESNELALEILTVIGCCLSIFGLCMVAATAALFRSWRRDYSNKIWLHLCAAIFLLVLCFLITVFARFEQYDVPCMLLGVTLHYAVLASFCWMLVAAVLSYRRLVIVFSRDASHKLLRASAFAWGAPCAVVGILLSVDPHSYVSRFEDKSPAGAFCYPSGLGQWLTVYAPIALMLVANWTLFALIVRSVFASRRIQRHGDSNEAIRCASVSCLLVFLFGLPWIFGLFSANIVAAYLFALTATYQGFVLFLFFVLGNKKTRDLWLNKLKIKQTRKIPVTSSTYTHRSTGFRVEAEGASTIEANSSKPRSLTSPDNSRFS